jgi:non-ribosomal peptide synthetase component F/thioesterase domain-containing protein/acyl carrier protein
MSSVASTTSFPLLPLQKGMLYHLFVDPKSGLDVEQVVGVIPEKLDYDAFIGAWQRVLDRHPALRTTFHWIEGQEPFQRVWPRAVASAVREDWSDLSAEERRIRLEQFIATDRTRGVTLTRNPAWRLAVFEHSETEFCFVFTGPHAAMDGRSIYLVLEEVFLFYEASQNHRTVDLPTPPAFSEFVEWLVAGDHSGEEAYWRAVFQGFNGPATLMIPGPSTPTGGRGEVEAHLPAELAEKLRELASKHRLTLNLVVKAAWSILLSRLSGTLDVVFGEVRMGRRASVPNVGSIAGLFINTVPVRIPMTSDMTVLDLLGRLRDDQRAVREHEHSALVDIQRWCKIPPGSSLFETLLVFDAVDFAALLKRKGGPWEDRKFRCIEQTSVPITFNVAAEPDFSLRFSYDRSRFDDGFMRRVPGHFRTLFEAFVADPERPIASLELLPIEERVRLLTDWNRTELPIVAEDTIPRLFEAQARQSPERIALICGEDRLTYRELAARVNRLARTLRKAGVAADVLVGICLGRSTDMLVSLLATMKAGGAYVPLDPTYPAERVALMVEDAKPAVLLTSRRYAERFSGSGSRVICLDGPERPQMEAESSDSPDDVGCAANLAYVIYTSGSTGRPKGVMLTQRNVVNCFLGMDRVLHAPATGTWLAVTSIAFDISVIELFWTLTRGFTLVLSSDPSNDGSAPVGASETVANPLHGTAATGRPEPGSERPLLATTDAGSGPQTLARLVVLHGVTHLQCTPSLAKVMVLDPATNAALQSLQVLLLGGEALPEGLLRQLGHVPTRMILNMYGPTETTIWSTAARVDKSRDAVPIGRPLANTRLYVLDPLLVPVPTRVPGELFIGGEGVARGYLRRPELTAERFIADPYSPVPGARMYRTGDLVRYRDDGVLDYLGRLDHQVKIRGHRVELGEVEAGLQRLPEIREAVVVAHQDAGGEPRLVAYITPIVGCTPVIPEVRKHLEERLPSPMVPDAFVMLDAFPLTPNGKIDRKALPNPEKTRPEGGWQFVAPRNGIEQDLAQIWTQTLGIERIGIKDSFFDLGGNSLSAAQMMVTLHQHFGVEFPLQILFERPTVARLADKLSEVMGVANGGEGESSDPAGAGEDHAPRTATERRLLAIWQRLLEVRPIGIRDRFFNLQGNSPLFDQMIADVKDEFGVFAEGLPTNLIMNDPTIEVMARIIEGAIEPASSLVVCLQPSGANRPLFLIHAGGGYVFFYRALASRLGPDRPVYGVRAETESDGLGRPFNRSKRIEEVATRYIAEIKTIQPKGPYLLGGACVGGVIAFEMAKQLRSQGEEVAGPVLLFDTFVANNPHLSREEESVILENAYEYLPRPLKLNSEWFRRRLAVHLDRASELGLGSGARYLASKFLQHAPSVVAKKIRAVPRKLRRLSSRFGGRSKLQPPSPQQTTDSIEISQQRVMADFMKTAVQIQIRYMPREYEGSIVLFKAKQITDPEPLWTGLARGGMVVYEMPGVHLEMMDEPAVATTAALVVECLERNPSPTLAVGEEAMARSSGPLVGVPVESRWGTVTQLGRPSHP